MFYTMLHNPYKRMFRGFYYTVQPEENIEIISKRYRIPAHNIILVNNLTYPYIIKEGDRLFIPGMDEPIASHGTMVHTVTFGENIDTIASKYGVTPKKLMEKNYLNNKNMTFIGEKLLVPQKENYIEAENANQNSSSEGKKLDEIRIFPFSQSLPKPGSTSYDNMKSITNKLPILKRGAKGSEVLKFQRLASAIGYKIRKFDGTFGSDLESVVREIQRKLELEETGIIDEKAWEYVFSKVNSMPGMMG